MVSLVASSFIYRLSLLVLVQICHFSIDLPEMWYMSLILGADSKSEAIFGLEDDITLKLAIFVILTK